MQNLGNIIKAAQQTLGARNVNISHQKVKIVATPLKADMSLVRNAQLQDSVEIRDSKGLQNRLGAVGANLSAQQLGEWKPLSLDEFVSTTEENNDGLRIVAELTADKLGGACMIVCERTDDTGNVSYHVGFEEEGLIENGEWLDESKKELYEQFYSMVAMNTELALEALQNEHPVGEDDLHAIDEALLSAGLTANDRHDHAAGESRVWSNTAPTKTQSGGQS